MIQELPGPNADQLIFDNNRFVAELSGQFDANLLLLEKSLSVQIVPKGNIFNISGGSDARRQARSVLVRLYGALERGQLITEDDVRAAIRFAPAHDEPTPATTGPSIKTPRRLISPRTAAQANYLETLSSADLIFGVGPAGTGKTYLAVAHAANLLLSGRVERIILSRPAVEAGERIGFLPGDMKEKVDPYLRPLYDALNDIMYADYVERRIASGDIEIAPLAFMRGRTLARSAVILDEAQNATVSQMKMFLTRLGEGSQMVITGDPTQSDLPSEQPSGLSDAIALLEGIEGVGTARFTAADVVRHPLVGRIIDRYEARDAALRLTPTPQARR